MKIKRFIRRVRLAWHESRLRNALVRLGRAIRHRYYVVVWRIGQALCKYARAYVALNAPEEMHVEGVDRYSRIGFPLR